MSTSPKIKLMVRTGVGAGVLMAAISGLGSTAGAAGTAPVLAPHQVAQYDLPAVDLVKTNTTATLNVYAPQLSIDAIVAFANQDSAVQQATQNNDDTTIEEALLKEIDANPGKYVSKGQATSYNAQTAAQGSAFTITPDGYIVTNAHVATVDQKELTAGFLSNLPQQQVDALVQSLRAQFATVNDANSNALQVPSDAASVVQDIVVKFVIATADSSNIHNTVTVYEGNQPVGDAGMVAKVVAAGQPFPGKDVAILKVDGSNLPTVPIGDDTALHDLDQVYAIGYPGAATFDPNVVKTAAYRSTVTEGQVSNRLQSSAANYQYIEHTATTNHGNSGGALINDMGQVVGITTAGDSSSQTTPVGNGGLLFYAVPSSVINELLHQAGITPSASPAQKLYDEATDLLAANSRAGAYAKLLQAKADGFNTPYLQQELAATGCPQGRGCRVNGKVSVPLVAGAGSGAFALLLVIAGASVRGRRRSVAAPPVPALSFPEAGTPVAETPVAETAAWWTTPGSRPVPPRLSDAPVVDAADVPSLSVAGATDWWTTRMPAGRS